MSENTYNAAIYVRLSKDDGNTGESDSIKNQKELIRAYLKNTPDITVVTEKEDDGYSGVNFERPSFIEMMDDIKAGRVNCVVVKDFSRLGRDYLQVCKFIQQIFPLLNVRFISINDNYDSKNPISDADKNILVPFKSIINDYYLSDVSKKTRSHLDIKRKKGEYIGNFVVYGYKKDENNKNRLVIDEDAAPVVCDIFKWKIEGLSQQAIADRLNNLGVLSPMEYKKSIGCNLSTKFKIDAKSKWSAVAVSRILKNNIYVGDLSQGKCTTPNHKVKKRIHKAQDEWDTVTNAHQAIISRKEFELANDLLKRDTRTAPTEEAVYLFSGMLFCGDCGRSFLRKTVPSNGKKYVYYVCKKYQLEKACTSHSIAESQLNESVFLILKKHIATVIELEKVLKYIETLPLKKQDVQKFNAQIILLEEELQRNKEYNAKAHENFVDGLFTKEEYLQLKNLYFNRCIEIEKSIAAINKEVDVILSTVGTQSFWIEDFKQYANITKLSRAIIANLIDKIIVYEGSRIEVIFRHSKNFISTQNFVNSVLATETEAV